MIPSTTAKAMERPCLHVQVKGRFFMAGPLPLPKPADLRGKPGDAMPPPTLRNGDIRVLRSPQGAFLSFQWVAKDKAWFRAGGYRLAFPAVYLGLTGWKYTGLNAPVALAAPAQIA